MWRKKKNARKSFTIQFYILDSEENCANKFSNVIAGCLKKLLKLSRVVAAEIFRLGLDIEHSKKNNGTFNLV